MHILFLFLDGVGLGANDPATNPLARADMPNLRKMLGGKRLLRDVSVQTDRVSLLALDAGLGVSGLPQSATGQAVLLTGQNVPAALGYHYGPKPNPPVAEFLQNGNLFSTLVKSGLKAAQLNAYPDRYFSSIRSGRRLFSSIPLAVTNAGIPLKTADDLRAGEALAADFTAQGWRTHLQVTDIPTLSAAQSGARLASLAAKYDFSLFEYWLTDYAGHGQDMEAACSLLDLLDQVLGSLFEAWDDRQGFVLLTSDHGNLEDLSTRRHTSNPVPGLLVGAPELRQRFIRFARESASRRQVSPDPLDPSPIAPDLTDITPAILASLGVD